MERKGAVINKLARKEIAFCVERLGKVGARIGGCKVLLREEGYQRRC